jgi:chaperone BCS1
LNKKKTTLNNNYETDGENGINTNMFSNRNNNSRITFANFLNVLDGVHSRQSGMMIFLSTNCIDIIDNAILRCGRIDVKQKFDYATKECIEHIFTEFYTIDEYDDLENMTNKFSNLIINKKNNYTISSLQEHLIKYKNTPQEAINNIDNIECNSRFTP